MRRAVIAAVLALALLVVAAGAALALGGYRVRGPSMEPALADGGLVLADPFARPDRFDAVVYVLSDGLASVKRVVGLPGDHVRVAPGGAVGPRVQVQVGGTGPWLQVIEPDSSRPWPGSERCCTPDGRASPETADATVPPGAYFLLGDNRAVSVDSRRHGFVPADRLRGTLVLDLDPLRTPSGRFTLAPP